MRSARAWRAWLAAVMLLAAACAGAGERLELGPEGKQAFGRMQQARRVFLERTAPAVQEILRSPLDGDSGRLRLAMASLLVINPIGFQADAQLLADHQSRLLMEDLLRRPRTRVATVADAMAYERERYTSREALEGEAADRLLAVELPAEPRLPMQAGDRLPPVEIVLRHAPWEPGELTGHVVVRIASIAGGEALWRRRCRVGPSTDPAWQAQPDRSRVARVACGPIDQAEQPEDLPRALAALQQGAARLDSDARVSLLPVRFDEGLPYAQAADRQLAGPCWTTSTCAQEAHAFLKGQSPDALAFLFLVLQIAFAGALLALRGRRGDAAPARRSAYLAQAYLLLVVVAHAAVVWIAVQPGGDGMVFVVAWFYLGIPLFGPGALVGLSSLWQGMRGASLRVPRVVLGLLVVTTPLLELLLITTLPSGYRG